MNDTIRCWILWQRGKEVREVLQTFVEFVVHSKSWKLLLFSQCYVLGRSFNTGNIFETIYSASNLTVLHVNQSDLLRFFHETSFHQWTILFVAEYFGNAARRQEKCFERSLTRYTVVWKSCSLNIRNRENYFHFHEVTYFHDDHSRPEIFSKLCIVCLS